MIETLATKKDREPSTEAPLFLFSQTSLLMSDRTTQAMEKALRNLANPMEANVTNIKHAKDRVVNEDFLRDMKSDQRNFTRRDAADLFTAPALANEKSTEREMSLPSTFFSRESLDDPTHAVIDSVSDAGSEDAHRAIRPKTVTGALGSDRSVVSESETDRESAIFLGNCATEDLDLVETAILRLLREDGRLSSKQQNEDCTKLKDALGLDDRLEGSEQTQSSAGFVDLQLLSRLLDQVQTLREQKYQHRQAGRTARSRGRSVWDVSKRGGKVKRVNKDDMKRALDAATQAAKSAADAAKNASSLVTKNSEAVSKLLQSLNPSGSKPASKKKEKKSSADDPHHSESSSDSEGSSDSEDVKDIAKKIVSQNRCTHVVLGIMLVSSFVWRYIVVKVVKRVKNKVTDPWGYVGGILSENFKGPEKANSDSSGGENSSGLPQLNLLNADREKEEKDASSSERGKEERSPKETTTAASSVRNGNLEPETLALNPKLGV